MRLMIAIPCGDTVRYEFCRSLANLTKHLAENGVDFEVRFHEGSLIYNAREQLTEEAINYFTHVLWLDSDINFSPDLYDLLSAMNKPFVTGIYRGRRGRFPLTIFKSIKTCEVVTEIPNEIFEIEACGFGCVLITTEALRRVRGAYGTCFTPTRGLGEDMAFCERWVGLGEKIYANPFVLPGHVIHIPITAKNVDKLIEFKELV